MALARPLALWTTLTGLCVAGVWTWRSVPPGPCVWSPTLAQAVRSGLVFEGIVVDDWTDTVIDHAWRIRRLRVYRFQVLRNWASAAGGHRDLEHGWYAGERYMRGTYRSFQRGRRYLVVATTHDSPGHAFTTSCFPGAEGAQIETMAAELGPPLATFEEGPLPHVPFWRPLVYAAEDAARIGFVLAHRAIDVIIQPSRCPIRRPSAEAPTGRAS